MNKEGMSHWLQVGANFGIIVGLVLVGFQLKQNSDLLRVELLYAESQSFINHERAMIGDNGSEVWAKSLEAPLDLSLAETRVMEAYLYALAEQWRASHLLHEMGILGDEWQGRIVDEAVYYLGNPYGRAWWKIYSKDTPIAPEMRALVQQQIDATPAYTLPYHMALKKELAALIE